MMTEHANPTGSFPLSEHMLFRFPTNSEDFASRVFLTDFTCLATVPKIRADQVPEAERAYYVSILAALMIRSTLNVERMDRKLSKHLRMAISR